jgi:DNA polymerase-3 subunit alpha
MAAMVEDIVKARTKRGGMFVRATFSDTSGQFTAACFEEALIGKFEQWAQEGKCLLLTVELDNPGPNEPPRITVRGARPLEEVTGSTPMALHVDVVSAEALLDLKLELGAAGGAQGEVIIRLLVSEDRQPQICLRGGYQLDGDLAERLAAIEGLTRIELRPQNARASLRLVA